MSDEAPPNTARELAVAIRNAREGSTGGAYTMLSVWAAMADKAALQLDEARGTGARIPLIGGGAVVMRREPADGE